MPKEVADVVQVSGGLQQPAGEPPAQVVKSDDPGATTSGFPGGLDALDGFPGTPQLQVWQRPVSMVLDGLALLTIGGLGVWTLKPLPRWRSHGSRSPRPPTCRSSLIRSIPKWFFRLTEAALYIGEAGAPVSFTCAGSISSTPCRSAEVMARKASRESQPENRPFYSGLVRGTTPPPSGRKGSVCGLAEGPRPVRRDCSRTAVLSKLRAGESPRSSHPFRRGRSVCYRRGVVER